MIDAHFHSWQLSRGDYGWLTPEIGPIYRDVSVADWQKLAQPLGITGGVLVQAAPTVAETLHLLTLAEEHPVVLGGLWVIGWVDFTATDAVSQIEQLTKHPKLKGLRPMLHDLPDPAWILQPNVQPALAAMEKLGLVFDALIRPVHLPHILKIAERYPKLSIVIDHCAKPEIARGADAAWQPWADGMAALATLPNVSCKLSGLLTEAGKTPEFNTCKSWAEYVLQVFGSERMMWGSDWPVLELAGDYRQWFEDALFLTKLVFKNQTNIHIQVNIFNNNAKRIYKL
ncbi:MAG: amidohydrolase family protein [Burkholderiaceae bacterium]